MSKKSDKKLDIVVEVLGFQIPMRIIYEYRGNVRVALGKDFVILRIPNFAANDTQKHIDFATKWLENLAKTKPDALAKYQIAKYEDNYSFTILDSYRYTVHVKEVDSNVAIIQFDKDFSLNVTIPKGLDTQKKRKLIRSMISKMVAKNHKPYIIDRIAYWNTIAFNKPISRISLKYNATNWGSCSSSGNINLSTRSLLLPKDVLDYIIVHELSHLVQMNHSDKFWSVVSNVMPDYRSKEDWINKHGMKLDF